MRFMAHLLRRFRPFKERAHILRQGSPKADLFPRKRLEKKNLPRVQRSPAKPGIRVLPERNRSISPSVQRIAKERMTDMRHMYADLMRPPGPDLDSYKGIPGVLPQHRVAGQRIISPVSA